MDRRKGDSRIYIVTALFLSCIVSGGIFLGLYLSLPNPNPLFLQAGMIFVGVPWLFWFLGYLYTCVIRPCKDQIPREHPKGVTNVDPEKANKNSNTTTSENATSEAAAAAGDNSTAEGERHVQFGDVTVIENVDEIGQEQRQEHVTEEVIVRGGDDRDDKDSDSSGNCDKTPLKLSINNTSCRD